MGFFTSSITGTTAALATSEMVRQADFNSLVPSRWPATFITFVYSAQNARFVRDAVACGKCFGWMEYRNSCRQYSSVCENLISSITIYVLTVVFVATLICSAFGFGEALIAVPLLAFCIPLRVAAPLAVLVSITISGIVVVQDWDKIHLRSTGWLVLSTFPGIPLGLLLLTSSHQRLVKAALALIIVLFCCYSLIGRTPLELRHDSRKWLLVCGFCAGVLGGAYGMNGPPLVIYGSMRGWSAQHFRATLQTYFLPASIVGMVGYWLAWLWVPAVTHYYLLSLPVTLPTVFLGRIINHRLHGKAFMNYVYLGLGSIGALLLLQAITGRL